MDRERIMEMFGMRLDGATYQEIADKYGITRQRVHALIGEPKNTRVRNLDFVVYIGLRKWMEENDISLSMFTKMIKGAGVSSSRMKDKLQGKCAFTLKEIIKIVNETGVSFEELFMQEQDLGEE